MRRLKDDRGASLVEYALLVAFIAIVSISALNFLGNVTKDVFTHVLCSTNSTTDCPTTTTTTTLR